MLFCSNYVAYGNFYGTRYTLDKEGVLVISGKGRCEGVPYIKRDSVKKVIIEEGITLVNGFYGCLNLTDVCLATSVDTIGYYGFRGCSSLKNINLQSVCGICGGTFANCMSLEEVELSSLKIIGAGLFDGCSSLREVRQISNIEGIDNYAFRGCSSLKNITLTSSCKHIGDGAFIGCGFESITIPDSVKYDIGYRGETFKDCTDLKQCTTPHLTSCMFKGRINLREVRITETSTFWLDAFEDCKKLSSIYIYQTSVLPVFMSNRNHDLFEYIRENVTFYVPNEMVNKYRETAYWRQMHIKGI